MRASVVRILLMLVTVSITEKTVLDSRPAIEVTGNDELTSLNLPNLNNVFSANTSIVIIIKGNPHLGMKKAEAERYYKAAHGHQYVVLEYEDTTTLVDGQLVHYIS